MKAIGGVPVVALLVFSALVKGTSSAGQTTRTSCILSARNAHFHALALLQADGKEETL
jgi:hypothetical protein